MFSAQTEIDQHTLGGGDLVRSHVPAATSHYRLAMPLVPGIQSSLLALNGVPTAANRVVLG
jgi:hypothetical protein